MATVNSLQHAETLQKHYDRKLLVHTNNEETARNIQNLRQDLDHHRNDYVDDEDTSVEVSFGNCEFKLSSEEPEPVYERLLNFGLNLKMKNHEKRTGDKEKHTPRITKSASNLKRDGTVEDILLKRKLEYNARVQDLRMKKERQEMKSMKSPNINKVSQDLVRVEPAYNRLYDIQKQTMAKREMMRTKFRKKEMKKYKGKPSINKVSKNMHRGVDAIFDWERQRKEKAARFKEQLKKQELAKCKPSKINPISDRIVQRMDRASRVEDHLIAQHQRNEAERENMKALSERKQQLNATPMISLHSASLKRDQPIFDRLYEASRKQEERKKFKVEKAKAVQRKIDPSTGQALYKPFINPRSASIKRNMKVEDWLQKKGKEQVKKRETLTEQFHQEILHNNQAKIGPYSQLLVDLMEKRTKSSTQDRIHAPIGQRFKRNTRDQIVEKRKSNTFSPEINPLSRAIDKNSHGHIRSNSRLNLLFKKGQDYKTKKQRLREQYEAEKLSECTFSPRASSPRNRRSGSVVKRAYEWARKKNKRMEEEREQKEQEQMQECTFQPNVYRKHSGRPGSPRSFTPPPRRGSPSRRYSSAKRSRTPLGRKSESNRFKKTSILRKDSSNFDYRSLVPRMRQEQKTEDDNSWRDQELDKIRAMVNGETIQQQTTRERESNENDVLRKERDEERKMRKNKVDDLLSDITIDSTLFSAEANALLRDLLTQHLEDSD